MEQSACYITNTTSLTVFRNRLKTFLFHQTCSGCPADQFRCQAPLNLGTLWHCTN